MTQLLSIGGLQLEHHSKQELMSWLVHAHVLVHIHRHHSCLLPALLLTHQILCLHRSFTAQDLGHYASTDAESGRVPTVYTSINTGEVRLQDGRHILFLGAGEVYSMEDGDRLQNPVIT